VPAGLDLGVGSVQVLSAAAPSLGTGLPTLKDSPKVQLAAPAALPQSVIPGADSAAPAAKASFHAAHSASTQRRSESAGRAFEVEDSQTLGLPEDELQGIAEEVGAQGLGTGLGSSWGVASGRGDALDRFFDRTKARTEALGSVRAPGDAAALLKRLETLEAGPSVSSRVEALSPEEASRLLDKLYAEEPLFREELRFTDLRDYPAYRTSKRGVVGTVYEVEKAVLCVYADRTGRDPFGGTSTLEISRELARNNPSFRAWLLGRRVPAGWESDLERTAAKLLARWAREVARRETPVPAGGLAVAGEDDRAGSEERTRESDARLGAMSSVEISALVDRLYAGDATFRRRLQYTVLKDYPRYRASMGARMLADVERAVLELHQRETGKDLFLPQEGAAQERPLLDPAYERTYTLARIGKSRYSSSRDGKSWLWLDGDAGAPKRLPRWGTDDAAFLERMRAIRRNGKPETPSEEQPVPPSGQRPAVLREQSPGHNTRHGMHVYRGGALHGYRNEDAERFIAVGAYGYHVTLASRLQGILTKGWLLGQTPTSSESAQIPGLHLATHLGVTYGIPGRTVVLRIAMRPGEFEAPHATAYYGHVIKKHGVSDRAVSAQVQFSPDGGVSWYPLEWEFVDLYELGMLPIERMVPIR
jgi:hypothetical protein